MLKMYTYGVCVIIIYDIVCSCFAEIKVFKKKHKCEKNIHILLGKGKHFSAFKMIFIYTCFIIDIDECGEKKDDCEDGQYCVNTLGSYQCHTHGTASQTCHPGFTFNRTARVCMGQFVCFSVAYLLSHIFCGQLGIIFIFDLLRVCSDCFGST